MIRDARAESCGSGVCRSRPGCHVGRGGELPPTDARGIRDVREALETALTADVEGVGENARCIIDVGGSLSSPSRPQLIGDGTRCVGTGPLTTRRGDAGMREPPTAELDTLRPLGVGVARPDCDGPRELAAGERLGRPDDGTGGNGRLSSLVSALPENAHRGFSGEPWFAVLVGDLARMIDGSAPLTEIEGRPAARPTVALLAAGRCGVAVDPPYRPAAADDGLGTRLPFDTVGGNGGTGGTAGAAGAVRMTFVVLSRLVSLRNGLAARAAVDSVGEPFAAEPGVNSAPADLPSRLGVDCPDRAPSPSSTALISRSTLPSRSSRFRQRARMSAYRRSTTPFCVDRSAMPFSRMSSTRDVDGT